MATRKASGSPFKTMGPNQPFNTGHGGKKTPVKGGKKSK